MILVLRPGMAAACTRSLFRHSRALSSSPFPMNLV